MPAICPIEMPTFTPQNVNVSWDNTSRKAPVVISHNETTVFKLYPPFGRMEKTLMKKAIPTRSGIGSAHKVANAVFHLYAIKCFADRCHPCVHGASFAVFLEDDVEYVEGVSPASFGEFPRLVQDAATDAFLQDGVVKLQLAVGNSGELAGIDQSVNSPGKKSTCVEHSRTVTGWEHTARFLKCQDYTDSHAYVLYHAHAVRIIKSHEILLKKYDGHSFGLCVNPWGSITCGKDPGVLRDFFVQCEHPKDRRPGFERRIELSKEPGRCKGLALAGLSSPWSLLHNNTEGNRVNLGGKSINRYTIMEELQSFVGDSFLVKGSAFPSLYVGAWERTAFCESICSPPTRVLGFMQCSNRLSCMNCVPAV